MKLVVEATDDNGVDFGGMKMKVLWKLLDTDMKISSQFYSYNWGILSGILDPDMVFLFPGCSYVIL